MSGRAQMALGYCLGACIYCLCKGITPALYVVLAILIVALAPRDGGR